jgi:addiction module RelB/DinJ family antitoxin
MKTITSVKIDDGIKREATKLAKQMGLSLSVVINASLKDFVSQRRLVFNIEQDLNKETKELLRKSLKEIKNKKNLVGPFNNISDLKRSLTS